MKFVISDTHTAYPEGMSAEAQWYSGPEAIKPSELIVDLHELKASPISTSQRVYEYLRERGLEAEKCSAMADALLAAIPDLHPATLGIVVRAIGMGHWQIVAERGQ